MLKAKKEKIMRLRYSIPSAKKPTMITIVKTNIL